MVDQPIVCRLVKDYDLDFTILKASVTPREQGMVVMELTGRETDFENGLQYLDRMGVSVQPLGQDIKRNEQRCIHCGACTSVCASDALSIDRVSKLVSFDEQRCNACEWCLKSCPVHAMEVRYEPAAAGR